MKVDPKGIRYQPVRKMIRVYVCPVENCGSYYGAAGMADLAASFTGPKTEDRGKLRQETGSPHRHNQAACPECRTERKMDVQRILIEVPVVLEHDVLKKGYVPPPTLPASAGEGMAPVPGAHRSS